MVLRPGEFEEVLLREVGSQTLEQLKTLQKLTELNLREVIQLIVGRAAEQYPLEELLANSEPVLGACS